MKNNSNSSFLKLFKRFIQYKLMLSSLLIVMLAVIVLQLSPPILIKIGIDKYIMAGDIKGLNHIVLLLGLIFCVEFFLSFLKTYITQKLSQIIMAKIRLDLFKKIERQNAAFFDRHKVGELVSRLTSDISNLEQLFATGFLDSLLKVVMIIIIVCILIVLNLQLALVVFSVLPAVSIFFLVFSVLVMPLYRKLRVNTAKLSGFLRENISGMSVIQSFSKESSHQRKFNDLNEELSFNYRKIITYFALFFPSIEVASSITIVLILLFGGKLILGGLLTIGTLVAFIDYIDKLFSPLKELSERYNLFQSAAASAERIFDLLEDQDNIIIEGDKLLENVKGYVEFRNVSFSYNTEPVLKNVSFKINPGEKIAFVGATGSGKSTILKLLTRFYEINEGSILIDKQDSKEYTLSSLRKAFGWITQDAQIFSASVSENISVFNSKMDQITIQDAAKQTKSARFIERLTDSYEEKLSEGGENLSVGEKQLLAITRLVAYKSKILLLDEATANIDVITEELINESLQTLMENMTTIVVAHRLATVKHVDRILVFDQGRIIEEGSHSELLEKKGLYHKLYKYQFKK